MNLLNSKVLLSVRLQKKIETMVNHTNAFLYAKIVTNHMEICQVIYTKNNIDVVLIFSMICTTLNTQLL